MAMKYLILQDFSGQKVPFIFPDRVDHVEMREQLPYGQLISGGYLIYEKDGFKCSGGNSELNIKARPEDDFAIIMEALAEIG